MLPICFMFHILVDLFQATGIKATKADDVRLAVSDPEELRGPYHEILRTSPVVTYHRKVRHSQEDCAQGK